MAKTSSAGELKPDAGSELDPSKTILELHVDEGPEDPSSIPQHVKLALGQKDRTGRTYAESVAIKWIQLALEGNMSALKEILARFAPIEDSGPHTIRYVLDEGPVPGGDEVNPA